MLYLLATFSMLRIKIADEVTKVAENISDGSIHNQGFSYPWARFCLLAIVVLGYCHSSKLSDVPGFPFDDLELKRYRSYLFIHRNTFICLPDHQSVKAPCGLTQRTSSFLLKLRNCSIYPQHLETFIVLPVYGLLIGQMTIYEIGT